MSLSDATNLKQLYDIQGNDFADKAAVQSRQMGLPEFETLCQEVRLHYQQQRSMFEKLLHYLLDLAYARMMKQDENVQEPDTVPSDPSPGPPWSGKRIVTYPHTTVNVGASCWPHISTPRRTA